MPRRAEGTRRRILDAAYDLFYRGGFARAGVDAVAEAAGITKRTLYYHYRSKDALLAAVLHDQHALMLARIQAWATRAAGDPARMVDVLFSELRAWASAPGWQGSGFTRAVMELAELPGHPARKAASRHKAAVEAWLAGELARGGVGDPGAVAREIMLLIEGSMALILVHGDPAYADAAAAAARRLVEDRLRGAERAAPMPTRPAG